MRIKYKIPSQHLDSEDPVQILAESIQAVDIIKGMHTSLLFIYGLNSSVDKTIYSGVTISK